ncbi:MAG: exodeoxyribonuclease III [Alphaproteobacteria bacterium]
MALSIATWNVNSIRVRAEAVLAWTKEHRPDVLCLQEIKCLDEQFPRSDFEELGYRVETFGQRTYNGVALLSREPASEIVRGLPDDDREAQRRVIAATVAGVRIWNVYVPNGQAVGSEKWAYKLDWLGRLRTALEGSIAEHREVVVCGDFNVGPEPRDVYDPDKVADDVLFHADVRAALASILDLGFVDTFRLHHDEAGAFSWWDYRLNAFKRRMGFRIDLVLATRALAERCSGCEIDVEPRRREQPSDHAPVVATFG